MQFNEQVHQVNEHGDPVRNNDGDIMLKTNWGKVAEDRQGRNYNPTIHGDAAKLDDDGFLTVRRREENRKLMSTENRSDALVAKHEQPGYKYYLASAENEGKFSSHDWEQVQDENGPVTLDGGQGRTERTELRLKRKPIEWYDEDQKEKARLVEESLQRDSAPDEAEGQYGEGLSSPLR